MDALRRSIVSTVPCVDAPLFTFRRIRRLAILDGVRVSVVAAMLFFAAVHRDVRDQENALP